MSRKIISIIILVIILILFFFLAYSCAPAQKSREDLSFFFTATNFIENDQIRCVRIDQIRNERGQLVINYKLYESVIDSS